MSRVLTVDIGNSNIVVGSWNDQELEFTGRIVTKRDYAERELENAICDTIEQKPCEEKGYDGAIISSVVPEITDKTLIAIEKITGKRPLVVGPFLRTGVDISRYKEGAIGMDRIVDMAAAVSMYGAPVMVCDLGTCTTITVSGPVEDTELKSSIYREEKGMTDSSIDDEAKIAKCSIIGGMICPGVQLSLDAQAQRASQLPQLQAQEVTSLLGLDTASNMMSGAVAGTGMMITELARRIRAGSGLKAAGKSNAGNELKNEDEIKAVGKIKSACEEYGQPDLRNLKIVVTGGLGKLVMPWIGSDKLVIPWIGSGKLSEHENGDDKGTVSGNCSGHLGLEVHYEPDLLLRGLKELYYLNE